MCNLQKLKNLDVVLHALTELDENIPWTYTIVGDGSERENLEQLISELGLSRRVRMLGYKRREKCLGLMRKSNVFIMPSAPETFGLAYLEAMASGCVVIGAEGWGIDGVVKDGVNGYLVAPRESGQIRQSLQTVRNTPKTAIIENSITTIKNYTAEEATKNYAQMIKLHSTT